MSKNMYSLTNPQKSIWLTEQFYKVYKFVLMIKERKGVVKITLEYKPLWKIGKYLKEPSTSLLMNIVIIVIGI